MTQTIAAARALVDRPRPAPGAMKLSMPAMKLSPRAKRGAAIVAACAVLLLLLAFLPYVWQASLRQQAAAQTAELELLRAQLLAREGARGPVITGQDPAQDMFLSGTTAGTTLADFQALVSEAAEGSGINVLRIQPLPSDEAKGLSSYRLAVDAAGSLEQLRTFLLDVEAMLPVVIVSGFEIVPRSAGGSEQQPYPSEDLAITLKLEAYAWRGAQ